MPAIGVAICVPRGLQTDPFGKGHEVRMFAKMAEWLKLAPEKGEDQMIAGRGGGAERFEKFGDRARRQQYPEIRDLRAALGIGNRKPHVGNKRCALRVRTAVER